jgi:hypothetical protein
MIAKLGIKTFDMGTLPNLPTWDELLDHAHVLLFKRVSLISDFDHQSPEVTNSLLPYKTSSVEKYTN